MSRLIARGLPEGADAVDECAAHRCMEHDKVPKLNGSCVHDFKAECGACAYMRGYQDAILKRIPNLFPGGSQ